MTVEFFNFLVRWGHLLFGITWIGMLYYFNFIQGGYFKSATPEALSDAKAKLAPSALWWFRWGAMFTFITGLYLLHVADWQQSAEQLHYCWRGHGYADVFECLGSYLASTEDCSGSC